MSDKKRKVEWSFDFEGVGERVGQLFGDIMGGEVDVKSAELTAPLDAAESAAVEIEFSIGKAGLRALDAASENLIEARIDYVGEYHFDVGGNGHRVVSLKQSGQFSRALGNLIGKRKELRWDIALARGLPLQLSIKGGVGETDIDLSDLDADAIKLQTGVGKIALILPRQSAPFAATVSGGVGKTDIVIPAGSYGRLDIEGGVGEVNVSVAREAAVRLSASAGMGKVDAPASYIRRQNADSLVGADGLWESENAAESEALVIINYTGGIGRFHLGFSDSD